MQRYGSGRIFNRLKYFTRITKRQFCNQPSFASEKLIHSASHCNKSIPFRKFDFVFGSMVTNIKPQTFNFQAVVVILAYKRPSSTVKNIKTTESLSSGYIGHLYEEFQLNRFISFRVIQRQKGQTDTKSVFITVGIRILFLRKNLLLSLQVPGLGFEVT